MGLFDAFRAPKYDELDPSSAAAGRIAGRAEALGGFAASANDRIEVVAGDGPLYAFVGKPPKAFGLLWFDDTGRHDVRSMMESKAFTRETASRFVEELPAIYSRHADDERFSYMVGGKSVVVNPSDSLYAELEQALSRAQA